MTPETALSLRPHQTIHHRFLKNADGSPLRARVNGKPVTQKRAGTWRVPLKHGLKTYFNLSPHNVNDWSINP